MFKQFTQAAYQSKYNMKITMKILSIMIATSYLVYMVTLTVDSKKPFAAYNPMLLLQNPYIETKGRQPIEPGTRI